MGVVALAATHMPFQDRVVLRQMEFCLRATVAFEAGRRRLAWIDYELARTSSAGDVQTPRPVTRFAPCLPNCRGRLQVEPPVSARGENTGDGRMALSTGLIAYERGAGHGWRQA